jgi:hypothetical protein
MSAPEMVTAEDRRVLAESARLGPADLAERVLRRYRRRRLRRSGLVAVVVAVVVAATVTIPAVLAEPHGGTGRQVADIPAGPGIWRVAANSDPLPDAATVWPAAVVDLPLTPDGGEPQAVSSAGPGKVLVIIWHRNQAGQSVADALDIYDVTTRGYRQLAQRPATPGWAGHWAISANRVYWSIDTDAGFDVYTEPLAGGEPKLLSHVTVEVPAGGTDRTFSSGPWYATDSAVYWSGMTPGIVSLSADGGTPQPVPGFGDYYLTHAGSPWVSRMTGLEVAIEMGELYNGLHSPQNALEFTGVTVQLKNLRTGAVIDVDVPAGTSALSCAANLCVGIIPDRPVTAHPSAVPGGGLLMPDEGPVTAYIQRPDGSDRVRLPAIDGITDVYWVAPVGDRGLVVSLRTGTAPDGKPASGWTISDPLSGQAGAISPAGDRFTDGDQAIGYPVTGSAPMTKYLLPGAIG